MSESRSIIFCAPDPGHVELLLEHLGLGGKKIKGASTAGAKSGTYHDETELENSKVTLCRSCVMRFSLFECSCAVLCKSMGMWHVQAHDRTLEPVETSCAVFADARTMGSRIPSSGTDELD